LLNDQDFSKADKIQLVNVIMRALDAPEALERQAALSAKGNSYAKDE